jgi:hypothetical protein
LGNSKKVKITSKGNGAFNFKNDFVFFDGMNFDFKMPDIDFSNIEAIVLPDMDFDFDLDFDFDIEDIEDFDENIGKNGRYDFIWNDGDDKVVIKSKKRMGSF